MAQVAKKDENGRNTAIVASSNDGVTILGLVADPITHRLSVAIATVEDSGNNQDNAVLDENSVPVWTALSSSGNGVIVEVYGNPITKALIVK